MIIYYKVSSARFFRVLWGQNVLYLHFLAFEVNANRPPLFAEFINQFFDANKILPTFLSSPTIIGSEIVRPSDVSSTQEDIQAKILDILEPEVILNEEMASTSNTSQSIVADNSRDSWVTKRKRKESASPIRSDLPLALRRLTRPRPGRISDPEVPVPRNEDLIVTKIDHLEVEILKTSFDDKILPPVQCTQSLAFFQGPIPFQGPFLLSLWGGATADFFNVAYHWGKEVDSYVAYILLRSKIQEVIITFSQFTILF